MNLLISKLSQGDKEKSIFIKRLITNWYFFILPFVILIFIKLYSSNILDAILVSDWSIASFIIYGQLITQITANSISLKKVKNHGLEFHVSKRIVFGLTFNILTYSLMSLKPNYYLGTLQIILFVYANLRFFGDNIALYDLQKASDENPK